MMLSRCWFAVLLVLSLYSLCSGDFFPDDYDDVFPERNDRVRRFIHAISWKPGPDAEPEMGIGLRGHLRNLLKGGSMKLKFNPELGRTFSNLRDQLRSFFAKGKELKDDDFAGRENAVPDYKGLIDPRDKKNLEP